jgi:hypothetical protein
MDQCIDCYLRITGSSTASWLLLALLIVFVSAWFLKASGKARRSATRSQFGRVSRQTATLLAQHVGYIDGPMLNALPVGASGAMRALTVRLVLEHTLEDWWRNGNTTGLDSADLDDLRGFIRLAGHVAGPGFRHEELAIYRAVLTNLLQDWLHNWNVDGVDGPPKLTG